MVDDQFNNAKKSAKVVKKTQGELLNALTNYKKAKEEMISQMDKAYFLKTRRDDMDKKKQDASSNLSKVKGDEFVEGLMKGISDNGTPSYSRSISSADRKQRIQLHLDHVSWLNTLGSHTVPMGPVVDAITEEHPEFSEETAQRIVQSIMH